MSRFGVIRFAVVLAAMSILGHAAWATAAIVDTFGAFAKEAPGWSGAVDVGFSASGGNTEFISVSSSAQAQWHRGPHRLRALGGYARQTNAGRELGEEAMGHLRHNYRVRGPIHSLAFAQVQHNPFQRLRSRTLLGAGGRIDVLGGDDGTASLGVAHMVEVENIEDESGAQSRHRLSTFVIVTAPLSASSSLAMTIYAQPRWDQFDDLRAVGTAALRVSITERLKLKVTGSFQHDSRPPAEVEQTDWSTRTSLEFSSF